VVLAVVGLLGLLTGLGLMVRRASFMVLVVAAQLIQALRVLVQVVSLLFGMK
jgi:hypothetical protein